MEEIFIIRYEDEKLQHDPLTEYRQTLKTQIHKLVKSTSVAILELLY